MMLSGFFLDLELSETLNLVFLRQEKITLLSSCYLKVLLPSNLVSLNLVINVVPFLHPSDCLGGSISDGFDRDVLFLASSVCVCANTGWRISISLFSLFAVPCSSLSVLLSANAFCLN